jgi:hypothetical protein
VTLAAKASAAEWLATARAAAHQPPAQARQPLWAAGQAVGSVATGILSQIDLWRLSDKRYQLLNQEHSGEWTWHLDVVPDAVTPALNLLAQALRAQGQCGPWRDEQLAVCNAHGERLGTIERGAVRVLGIATRAVHLVGRAPDGRIWVQQRSKTKPNNPGMWDTLMGGMAQPAGRQGAGRFQNGIGHRAQQRVDALESLIRSMCSELVSMLCTVLSDRRARWVAE